jgi:hypothetical protein
LIADHNAPYQVPKKMLDAFAPENRSEVKYFKKPGWEFKQRGQSGLWISDLFPKIAERADELCLIRSMYSDNADHAQATLGIHTWVRVFHPSEHGILGQLRLGIGECEFAGLHGDCSCASLCGGAIVVRRLPAGMSSRHTCLPGPEPVPNIRRRLADAELQEEELGMAQAFNRRHLASHGNDSQLAARIRSLETAFGYAGCRAGSV